MLDQLVDGDDLCLAAAELDVVAQARTSCRFD